MRLLSLESMTKMSPWVPVIIQFQLLILDRVVYRGLTRKVMSPQGPYLVLSAHVPDIELDILVCDRFDVETNSRYGGDVLI